MWWHQQPLEEAGYYLEGVPPSQSACIMSDQGTFSSQTPPPPELM